MASFDSAQSRTDAPVRRRALFIGGQIADALRLKLADSGYETSAATTGTFARIIPGFVPDVILIVVEREVDAENDAVAVARRLREEPGTHALPLVLVYVEEERLMRSVALNVGVDDCFGIWTPHGQILARLDALFWRIEAGRRAATMSGDKRFEIDNFMVLLEAVREDMRAAARGSVALIYARPPNEAGHVFDRRLLDRTIVEAHGFFKLNLRRIDAVGFYGPTTLLIYLPRLTGSEARSALMSLRASFLAERADSDIAIGIASFPDDSSEVEVLIELAEAAAGKAREFGDSPHIDAPSQEEVEEPDRVLFSESVEGSIESTTDHVAQISQQIVAPVERKPVQGDAELDHSTLPVKPATDFEESVVKPSSVRADPDNSSHIPGDKDKSHIVHEAKPGEPDGIASRMPVAHRAPALSEIDVARAAAEQAAARERELRKRGATIPRRLLLTVSDAARMAQLNALVRSAGYEARTAFDGQQALDLLRIESPDVLLLDFELRGIDGLEMLRRLHKQTKGKLTVPVVMLLPPSQVMARREALELGACGIVAMPYDPAELLDSVRLAGNGA